MGSVKFFYLLIFNICFFNSIESFSSEHLKQMIINGNWENVIVGKSKSGNEYSSLYFQKRNQGVKERKVDGLPDCS